MANQSYKKYFKCARSWNADKNNIVDVAEYRVVSYCITQSDDES